MKSSRQLGAALVGLIVTLAQAERVTAESIPESVLRQCGDQTISSDNLCNVAPSLHQVFILVEQIADAKSSLNGSRIAAPVRDHLVVVEWYPEGESLQAGILGVYTESRQTVWLALTLRDEPARVQASVLGHELAHASWSIDDLGSGLEPVQECLQGEARSYIWGLVIYQEAMNLTDEAAPPIGKVDAYLEKELGYLQRASAGGQVTDAVLEDLARNYLFRNGYADQCSWRR